MQLPDGFHTATAHLYRTLDTLPCAELMLSQDGDVVLFELKTGHDWSTQPLRVDTDQETIELGPWYPDGSDTAFLFILEAPECGGDCSCARLIRRHGEEEVVLPLGRRCD